MKSEINQNVSFKNEKLNVLPQGFHVSNNLLGTRNHNHMWKIRCLKALTPRYEIC